MKLLVIGSDRNIFKKDSDAQKRIRDYGKLFEELRIIVFADAKLRLSNLKISENLFVHPTNHRFRLLYLWNIFRIIRDFRGDFVVSCQDPFESGLAAWLVSRRLGSRFHIQIHTDIFSPHFASGSLMGWLRIFLAKFLLLRADKIRVVSRRIFDSLKSDVKYQMSNVSVLPVFVDIKKIRDWKIRTDLHSRYPSHDFIMLMASRLTKEKNIEMAIEAFAGALRSMHDSNPVLPKNPLLLIVGGGSEELSLKSLATGYKLLDTNIVFEPWSDDLFSYYKTADLFLLTSNYEGYGRTVVEAMASGLPVVMTDVGLAGDILIDDLDGFVVPVGEPAILSEIVVRLMGDPEKLADIRRQAQNALRDFPEKKEYLDLYKKSF